MADAQDAEFLALQEALLGRYSLQRELGRGGLGIVYLAHEVRLDRPVALKVLGAGTNAGPVLRAAFLREARAAAKLSHPHIVPIHAVDEVEGRAFFAMAYIDGVTLGERIRAEGPLPTDEAAKVIREVAWALGYAHAEGLVHGSVKPGNIFLQKGSGRTLVTDFGIAEAGRSREADGGDEDPLAAAFVSREQAAGEPVDARSDLYSLGAVGYYCLTGRPPFDGESAAAVCARHVDEPADPVASVAPEVPARLARAIDRCLRKKPEDRYTDGGALADALGEGKAVSPELPVPLRIYLQNLRGLAGTVPLIMMLWALIALAVWGIAWSLELETILVHVVGALMLAGVTLGPLGRLGLHTRTLLEAGYELDDARLALKQDVERRVEEIRFEFGKEVTIVDHVLRWMTWGGIFGGIAAAFLDGALGFPLLEEIAITGIMGGTWSGIFGAFRNKRRRDAVGEGWLKILRSRVGKWLFKLGGRGLTHRALGSGAAHRPTEVAIGMAADRLFEDLPRSIKRDLAGLPETIRRLEADAQKMRKQADDLSGLLAEIGDDPARVGAKDRAKLRDDLVATRDEAQARMTEAVSALERIRLGLLRLHAGDGAVERVTADLGTAHEISVAIEGLLSGRENVERLLEERHTTVP